MKEQILDLTKKLVAIQSDPDKPGPLHEALETALSELSGFTIERFLRDGVESALVYNMSQRPSRFKILLNGHLDVIPGKPFQYKAVEKDGRLYGVGTMDMKSNLAAMIYAFKTVARNVQYPLALQLVTDEEVGGFNGTKLQVEEGVRADFVLSSEPTNFDIVHKAKSVLWLEIVARGTTAHGAYPWRGDNAVWKMNQFLNTLREHFPIPTEEVWATTVNLSSISTGNAAYNKSPDDCRIGLDVRSVPEDGDVLAKLMELLPPGFEYTVLANEPAMQTAADDMYIDELARVGKKATGKDLIRRGAHGSSDARHFAGVGCPGVEFGPIGGGIGSDNEWVEIASLELYYEILVSFLRQSQAIER